MSEKYADFDYSRELPGSWSSRLMQLKHEGYAILRARVFWGSHESLPGIRDFTKMSRLRLERFLALAEEHSFQVDLICGFNFEAECYPQWSFSLPRQALIPSGLRP